MNLNKVFIIGRLTRDPDVRTTQNGQTITTVGLATNRVWIDKAGQKQEQAEYHNVVMWGKLADIAGQYMQRGQEVLIEGHLQTRTFVGKDNIERRTTEIVAESMQLGQRPYGGGAGGERAPRPSSGGDDRFDRSASRTEQSAATRGQTTQNEEDIIPTINLDDEKDVRIGDVPF